MSVLEITLFVIIILIGLSIGLSIVWSTLTLGISPMPSSKQARQVMLMLLDETLITASAATPKKKEAGPIYELGSGWGGLLISLAEKYPQRNIIAYELSIMPWLTTIIRLKVLGLKNVTVHRQNFLNADLTDAAVILCYLFPRGMNALEAKIKLSAENTRLEYLISNNFSLLSHQAIKTIQLNDLYKSPVYLYQF